MAFAKKAWEQEGEEVDVLLDQPIRESRAVNPNITVERTHDENEALRNQFQTAAQWRFGGGPADTNHTRIIDPAWDGIPTQEELLSQYPSTTADIASLGPDDFAQLPLLRVK